MNKGIEIKASFNNQFRRFELPKISFNLLVNTLMYLFEFSSSDEFLINYKDEDEDLVCISSDMELQYAIRKFFKDSHLRLYLTERVVLHRDSFKTPRNDKSYQTEESYTDFSYISPKKQITEENYTESDIKCNESGKVLAKFVKDVSIPDCTCMWPNTSFVKTWRFKNTGNRPWPKGSQLVFIGNSDKMSGPDYVSIPESITVKPGDNIDISVPLVAPPKPGRYLGYWRMRDRKSRMFFGQPVWVKIDVVDPSKFFQYSMNYPTFELVIPFSADHEYG